MVVPWDSRESLLRQGQEDAVFVDYRHGWCEYCPYCGKELKADNQDREHSPSRVFLDSGRPKPGRVPLPTVPACMTCNRSFSKDEEFVSALIECWRCSTTDPNELQRKSVCRALARSPGIQRSVRQVLESEDGIFGCERFWRIMAKLVRGHVYFELNRIPVKIEPSAIGLHDLSLSERRSFEEANELTVWPELGSRAFIDAAMFTGNPVWWELQKGCYRYMVVDGDPVVVRMVLFEHLAVHAKAWLEAV